MEIRILEERTNPLLKRHELRFEVAHATEATPTRDSVRTELAKAVHAPKDRVVIERMGSRFGTAVTRGEANVYDSADAAKSITRAHILVRNGLKEKETKGTPSAPAPSAPAGAQKPEAPAPASAPEPAPPVPHPAKAAPPSEAPPHEPAPRTADAGATPPSEAPKRGKGHPKKE